MTSEPSRMPSPPRRRDLSRPLRLSILLAGLIVPQFIFIGPSLLGRKILLPLDQLRRSTWYMPDDPSHPDVVRTNWILSDLILQHEPHRQLVTREVRAGRLPLWNPYNYCGAPLLAINHAAVFSPYRLLDYLWPGPGAIAWGRLLQELVAGLGAYLFFRGALRVSFWPAVIGGWAYPLGGFLTFWLGQQMASAASWLGFLLWATDGTVRRPRGLFPLLLGLLTGVVLVSGHAETAAQMLVVDGVYALWAVWRTYRRPRLPGRAAFRALLALVGAWFLGIALSLPQTLPTAEYLKSSYRIAARQSGYVETPPTGIAALPQFFLPYFYGDSAVGSLYVGTGALTESAAAGYAGLVLSLGLAPLGWLSRRHRGAILIWLLIAIAGAGQILAIPGLAEIFRAPGFNMLRNNRWVFGTGFGLLTCAVVGLHVVARRQLRFRVWMLLLAIPPIVLALACQYIRQHPFAELTAQLSAGRQLVLAGRPRPQMPTLEVIKEIPAWFDLVLLQEAGWSLAPVVVLVFSMIEPSRASRLSVIAMLALGELVYTAWGSQPQSDPKYYYPPLQVFSEIARQPPGRMLGVGCLPPNVTQMWGMSDVRGYDAVDPIRIVELTDLCRDPHSVMWEYAHTAWWVPFMNSPILDLVGLRHLVFRQPPADMPVTWSGDGHFLVERPTTLSRASVPRRVEIIDDKARRLARLADPSFDPHDVVIVQDAPAAIRAGTGHATIVDELPTRVTIKAEMQTPGVVLLIDQWDPGWHAYVDGTEWPIYIADHAFRAVEAPAGQSIIEFRYQPASFTWGVRAAALAALAMVGWAIGVQRGRLRGL